MSNANSQLSALDINVFYQEFSLWHLLKRIEDKTINLYPEFQRVKEWDDVKKSRLIESLLIRFPIPVFYFTENNNGVYDVLDGLHRLLTFKSFFNDEFALSSLEYLPELNGCKLNKLREDYKGKYIRRLEETKIGAYILKNDTPVQVIKNLFIRLNTTANVFNNNEIRHILHYSDNDNFITEIINHPTFTQAVNFKNESLIEEELVLRYIGFMFFSKEYKGKINDFLDYVIVKVKEFKQREKSNIEQSLIRTLDILFQIFNNNLFKKSEDDAYPIKSLFEVWTVCFSQKTIAEQQQILANKVKLIKNYSIILKNDTKFKNAIKNNTTSVSSTKKRFDTINGLLNQIL